MDDIVAAVRRSLGDEARRTFDRRVERQAAYVREEIESGALDNHEFAVGLELEAYAVDDEGRLAALPAATFEGDGPAKELGLHNAEVNTDPDVFDADGLAHQAASIDERMAVARDAAAEHDRELVLDAMWTIPPAEGSQSYLSAVDRREGVVLAENMRLNPRYCALDNDIVAHQNGEVTFSVPGADLAFPTMLAESLATSIQPHLQVPSATDFPDYYNAGIRTLGPVLALATNSPLLPPDCYDDPDPDALLDETDHELRIAVFEGSVNADDPGKVRFPGDITGATDVVDRLVGDDVRAPFLSEWTEGGEDHYTDAFWELDHKRGTYWRWLRAVVGGDPVGTGDERSLRIEYRPLPTQPSIADVVGLQWLTVGLLRGLVVADHPITDLAWERARESFYAAAADGIDADLHWVTADGDHTTDSATVFAEVFDYARRGLREQGLADDAIDGHLAPIERRWTEGRTPSQWKLDRVRERLDAGAEFETAVHEMQRTYIERQRSGDPFVEW